MDYLTNNLHNSFSIMRSEFLFPTAPSIFFCHLSEKEFSINHRFELNVEHICHIVKRIEILISYNLYMCFDKFLLIMVSHCLNKF